jgi:hypothetical protein
MEEEEEREEREGVGRGSVRPRVSMASMAPERRAAICLRSSGGRSKSAAAYGSIWLYRNLYNLYRNLRNLSSARGVF